MHKTSLNISTKMKSRLKETSKDFNISQRQLVEMIFKYCHRRFNFNILVTGELTHYQKKAPGDKWQCLRIDINDAECDVYCEYRKIFRISLSKILAVGFVLFFDLIIAELSGTSEENKPVIDQILNSYTETKQILYKFVEDSFKYFIINPGKEP